MFSRGNRAVRAQQRFNPLARNTRAMIPRSSHHQAQKTAARKLRTRGQRKLPSSPKQPLSTKLMKAFRNTFDKITGNASDRAKIKVAKAQRRSRARTTKAHHQGGMTKWGDLSTNMSTTSSISFYGSNRKSKFHDDEKQATPRVFRHLGSSTTLHIPSRTTRSKIIKRRLTTIGAINHTRTPTKRWFSSTAFTNPDVAKRFAQLQTDYQSNIDNNFMEITLGHYAKTTPDTIAIRTYDISQDTIHEYTYNQWYNNTLAVADYLNQKGISHDAAVAYLASPYEPGIASVITGVIGSNRLLFPLPHGTPPQNLVTSLNHMQVECVFVTPDNKRNFDTIRHLCPSVKEVVMLGNQPILSQLSDTTHINDIFDQPRQITSLPKSSTDTMTVALRTSGTTGEPKVALHDQRFLYAFFPLQQALKLGPNNGLLNACPNGWGYYIWTLMTILIGNARLEAITSTDNLYNLNPFGWGFTNLCWTLMTQLTDSRWPEKVRMRKSQHHNQQLLKVLNKGNVSHFAASPSVLSQVIQEPDFKTALKRLNWITAVGECFPPSYHDILSQNGIEICRTYGQAEMAPSLIEDDNKGMRPTSLYKVLILDDHGKPTKPGEPGRIAIYVPSNRRPVGLFACYANNPDKTRNAYVTYDNKKYYIPGDKAVLNKDGTIEILGRTGDTIKTRHALFHPFEIEQVAIKHAAIEQVAVIGIPTSSDNHIIKVKMFIVLKSGYEENSSFHEELDSLFEKELLMQMKPDIIEIVSKDVIPRTESGKIKREALKQRELELLRNTNVSPRSF